MAGVTTTTTVAQVPQSLVCQEGQRRGDKEGGGGVFLVHLMPVSGKVLRCSLSTSGAQQGAESLGLSSKRGSHASFLDSCHYQGRSTELVCRRTSLGEEHARGFRQGVRSSRWGCKLSALPSRSPVMAAFTEWETQAGLHMRQAGAVCSGQQEQQSSSASQITIKKASAPGGLGMEQRVPKLDDGGIGGGGRGGDDDDGGGGGDGWGRFGGFSFFGFLALLGALKDREDKEDRPIMRYQEDDRRNKKAWQY